MSGTEARPLRTAECILFFLFFPASALVIVSGRTKKVKEKIYLLTDFPFQLTVMQVIHNIISYPGNANRDSRKEVGVSKLMKDQGAP
jgi:hypothetical protein